MATEGLQIGLAVSLHAPNDALRNQLVPINRRYPVGDLLSCVKRYIEVTKRRVTFEYALMRGVNDSVELASELGAKLRPLLCHVNLIPLNPISGSRYQPTSDEDATRFMEVLQGSRSLHYDSSEEGNRDRGGMWSIAESGDCVKELSRQIQHASLLETGAYHPLAREEKPNRNYAFSKFLMHEVHMRLETSRPSSTTFTFWMLMFQRRRVAFFDHGRLLPNIGPRPQR